MLISIWIHGGISFDFRKKYLANIRLPVIVHYIDYTRRKEIECAVGWRDWWAR